MGDGERRWIVRGLIFALQDTIQDLQIASSQRGEMMMEIHLIAYKNL